MCHYGIRGRISEGRLGSPGSSNSIVLSVKLLTSTRELSPTNVTTLIKYSRSLGRHGRGGDPVLPGQGRGHQARGGRVPQPSLSSTRADEHLDQAPGARLQVWSDDLSHFHLYFSLYTCATCSGLSDRHCTESPTLTPWSRACWTARAAPWLPPGTPAPGRCSASRSSSWRGSSSLNRYF